MSETLRLSFQAQSLDNSGSDPMQQGGRLLSAEDHGRESLVERVSHVSVFGTCVFDKSSVSAFLEGNEFIVEVPSEQTDTVGRVAPIVCYGDSHKDMDACEVERELKQFAERIGRSISSVNLRLAQEGLKELERRAEDEECWLRQCVACLWRKLDPATKSPRTPRT